MKNEGIAAPSARNDRARQGRVARTAKPILVGLLLTVVTALAVLSLLVRFYLPSILQRFACAPYGIHCIIRQAQLRSNLNLTADLVVHHLAVIELGGQGVAFQARRITVSLDLWDLITSRRMMPTGVRIDTPALLARTLDDGRWNLAVLVQEIRRHLRPQRRVTPWQLPRISLNDGALQVGDRRITGLNLYLEPKTVPRLFEVRARAAIEGTPVQVIGTLNETLDGEVHIESGDVLRRGALDFRLDPAGRTLAIREWTVEDAGVLARGTGAIRYAEWPPTYEMTIAEWHVDLATLQERLSLHWLADFNGQARGEPTILHGRWPHLPEGSLSMKLTGIGFQLPTQRSGLSGISGSCRLRISGNRLHAQADLRGEAAEVLAERLPKPTLNTRMSADLTTGDISVEEIHASVSGMQLGAKGTGKRWGRDGLDLTTTKLAIEPGMLNRLLRRAEGTLAIKAVQYPSLHIRWSGRNLPWTAEITSRSLQLASPTWRDAVTLQGVGMTLQGIGTSWSTLQGLITGQQVDVAGRRLLNLMARLEIHPDRVQVPVFRAAVAGGSIEGEASFARSSPLRDLRAALAVRGLHVQHLLPATTQPPDWPEIALDADISATLSHGQAMARIDLPPAVTRQMTRLLKLRGRIASAQPAAEGHLVLLARGTFQGAPSLQASGSVQVQGLRALLADGVAMQKESPVDFTVGYRDGLFTVRTEHLDFTTHELTPLFASIGGGRIHGGKGSVAISANVTFGGTRPPAGGGLVAIQGLSLELRREGAPPVPLLRELTGSVAFTLDKGRLAVKETILQEAGGLALIVSGSLPLGQTGRDAARLRLTVPWTETSPLLPSLVALTQGRLEGVHLSGQIHADVQIVGQAYEGSLALRGVTMESNLLRLNGVSGSIPLAGNFGLVPVPNRAPDTEEFAWSHLSETVYQAALERSFKRLPSSRSPYSLTIASLRYGPIEIRNFETSLASAGDRIAIERFAFEVEGGKATGRGMIHPLSLNAALALLFDGLSLRAICDAFPPIKGYISGRINGLADVSVSGPSFEKVQGRARFWAVDSREERREISRTLIEKLAGQRIRYFSLFGQDRRYDRGVLDVALKRGDLIFHELDISHSTFGIKDLDVKASPTFNRIGFAHLLDSIRTATERIKAKAEPNP